MSKKRKMRMCCICDKFKSTTNTEIPFVCEDPCLWVYAREMLLNGNQPFIKLFGIGRFVIAWMKK